MRESHIHTADTPNTHMLAHINILLPPPPKQYHPVGCGKANLAADMQAAADTVQHAKLAIAMP